MAFLAPSSALIGSSWRQRSNPWAQGSSFWRTPGAKIATLESSIVFLALAVTEAEARPPAADLQPSAQARRRVPFEQLAVARHAPKMLDCQRGPPAQERVRVESGSRSVARQVDLDAFGGRDDRRE